MWYNCFYEVIIGEIFVGEYDILIKVICKYDMLEFVIFILIDWYLMCKCLILVLLVKNVDWLENVNIIVFVYVGFELDIYIDLNDCMVE